MASISPDQPWTFPPHWPSTSTEALWLFNTNHPRIMHASAVTADEGRTVIAVNCPSGECESTDSIPQTVTYNMSRPTYEGERIEAGTTTYWICGFLNGSTPMKPEPVCAHTTGEDVERPVLTEAATTTTIGLCGWHRRAVAVEITAGMEELYKVAPFGAGAEKVADNIDRIATAICSNTGNEPIRFWTGMMSTMGTTPTARETEPASTIVGETVTTTGNVEETALTDGSGGLSYSAALMAILALSSCSTSFF